MTRSATLNYAKMDALLLRRREMTLVEIAGKMKCSVCSVFNRKRALELTEKYQRKQVHYDVDLRSPYARDVKRDLRAIHKKYFKGRMAYADFQEWIRTGEGQAYLGYKQRQEGI